MLVCVGNGCIDLALVITAGDAVLVVLADTSLEQGFLPVLVDVFVVVESRIVFFHPVCNVSVDAAVAAPCTWVSLSIVAERHSLQSLVLGI